MNLRRLLTAVLLSSVGVAHASAHDVAPEPTVDVHLRPLGGHLTVELRLPIEALADANLPRNPDGHFVPDEIGQALELVARGIARDLEIQQGDDLLAMPTVSASLSADEALAAVLLDYLIRPDRSDLSARLRSFRAGRRVITTEAHYVVDLRTTRTFRIAGDPERVAFDPSSTQVFARFLSRGTDLLLDGGDFFLFGLCLIAPLGRKRSFARACGALLAGQVCAIGLSGFGRPPLPPGALLTVQAVAASAIVVAALQDLVSPHSRWLWPLAFAFGLANGLSIGDQFLRESAFAGSRSALGLLAWILVVTLGQLWALVLLSSAADLLRRRGRTVQLAVLALSLFAGHSALHRLVDRSELLAELGAITLDRFLMILTLAWASVILCAGILQALWFRVGTFARPSLADAGSGQAE